MKQVKFMGSFILCFLLISITFFTKLSFAQTDVPLSITSNFYLPNAIAGMVYETSINAIGGNESYLWSITNGSLPPKLNLITASCFTTPCQAPITISGIPETPGVYTFFITVVSGRESHTKDFEIIVIADTPGEIRGCTADTYRYRQPTKIPGFTITIDGEIVSPDNNGSCYKKQGLSAGLHRAVTTIPSGYSNAYYWACRNCPAEAPANGHSSFYFPARISNDQANIDVEIFQGEYVVLWWRYFPETPIGWLDKFVLDNTGSFTTGWVLDPGKSGATQNRQIGVTFYVDGPKELGVYSGRIVANIPYSDVEMPFVGDHGFYWHVPDQFKDGNKHELYAYGVDTETGTEYALTQTPQIFVVSSKNSFSTPSTQPTSTPTSPTSPAISPAISTDIQVQVSALNVRQDAALSAPKMSLVYRGEVLKKLEEKNGWIKVQLFNNQIGWVFGQYTTPVAVSAISTSRREVIVTAWVLNVRSGSGINTGVIATVQRNDVLEKIDEKNGWFMVILPNGQSGWVHGKFVK